MKDDEISDWVKSLSSKDGEGLSKNVEDGSALAEIFQQDQQEQAKVDDKGRQKLLDNLKSLGYFNEVNNRKKILSWPWLLPLASFAVVLLLFVMPALMQEKLMPYESANFKDYPVYRGIVDKDRIVTTSDMAATARQFVQVLSQHNIPHKLLKTKNGWLIKLYLEKDLVDRAEILSKLQLPNNATGWQRIILKLE